MAERIERKAQERTVSYDDEGSLRQEVREASYKRLGERATRTKDRRESKESEA